MATPSLEKNTIIEKLLGAGQSAERDLLFSRYFALVEEIDKYLDEHKSRRIAELQERRASLWEQCRAIEDQRNNLQSEAGTLNGQANQSAGELSAARARMSETLHRPFASQFPNAAEIADWQERKIAAKMHLDQVIERHRGIFHQIDAYKHQQQMYSHELHDRVEELREVDGQLNDIQGIRVKS